MAGVKSNPTTVPSVSLLLISDLSNAVSGSRSYNNPKPPDQFGKEFIEWVRV